MAVDNDCAYFLFFVICVLFYNYFSIIGSMRGIFS